MQRIFRMEEISNPMIINPDSIIASNIENLQSFQGFYITDKIFKYRITFLCEIPVLFNLLSHFSGAFRIKDTESFVYDKDISSLINNGWRSICLYFIIFDSFQKSSSRFSIF